MRDRRAELISIVAKEERAIRSALPTDMDEELAMAQVNQLAFEAPEKYFGGIMVLLSVIGRNVFYTEAILQVMQKKYGADPQTVANDVIEMLNELANKALEEAKS